MTDLHAAAADEQEPQSPAWLPALGLALFVAAGIAWSVCAGSGDHVQPAGEPSGSTSAAPSAAPPGH
jgi:hypothetical protein